MPTTPAGKPGEDSGEANQQGVVQTALGIASSLVALGAYVYLLGGFVLWLKFTAARLPTDNAVGALDGNRMLAVGLKALVFELVLVAALLGLAFLAWEGARIIDVNTEKRKQKKEGQEDDQAVRRAAELDVAEKWEVWRRLLQALIVAILAGSFAASFWRWALPTAPPTWVGVLAGLVAAGLWRLLLGPFLRCAERKLSRRAIKTWLTVIAAGLAVFLLAAPAGVGVLVLLLFLHLSHLLKELHRVTEPTPLILAVLIVAGCLSLVVAMYLATPPVALDSAVVVVDKEGRHTVHGGYVGRSSDGVYLAVCAPARGDPRRSTKTRLRMISASNVRRIELGGRSGYVLDDRKNSSLFDMASYAVSREPLGEWVETVALDVRESELTCGFPHRLAIVKRRRDRGVLKLEMTVPDDGTLTLYGADIQRRQVEVEGAGRRSLKVEPEPDARVAHRCKGGFETTVRASFRHGDDLPQIKMATVTLANPSSAACRGNRVQEGRTVAFHRGASRPNAR